MKSVQVLMSTYNGEKYIAEQLDSIINQIGVNIYILIRDDGSKDKTKVILKEYENRHDFIKVKYGDNVGWKKSFMSLIYDSGNFDYYAFADQDDVWLPKKILVGVEMMNKSEDIASLYYSWSTMVDENLNEIKDYRQKTLPEDKIAVLLNPWAQGSTIIFNKRAKVLTNKYKIVDNCAHDMWMHILCYYFGKIYFDPNSHILYRQHSENVTSGLARGINRKDASFIKKRIRQFIKGDLYINYARYLILGYNEKFKTDDKKVLEKFLNYKTSYKSRFCLIFNRRVKKETICGTIILKLSILFSKFSEQ